MTPAIAIGVTAAGTAGLVLTGSTVVAGSSLAAAAVAGGTAFSIGAIAKSIAISTAVSLGVSALTRALIKPDKGPDIPTPKRTIAPSAVGPAYWVLGTARFSGMTLYIDEGTAGPLDPDDRIIGEQELEVVACLSEGVVENPCAHVYVGGDFDAGGSYIREALYRRGGDKPAAPATSVKVGADHDGWSRSVPPGDGTLWRATRLLTTFGSDGRAAGTNNWPGATNNTAWSVSDDAPAKDDNLRWSTAEPYWASLKFAALELNRATGHYVTRDGWSASHRSTDPAAGAFIRLTQPEYIWDGTVGERLWTTVPNVEFRVQGLKLTWPGQTTPTWTDNAAVVLFWFLTERLGIDEDSIDAGAFATAYAACEAAVGGERRYSVNGIFSADDGADAIDDILQAMQGELVMRGGKFFIYAGVQRPVAKTITDADLVATLDGAAHFEPGPSEGTRRNSLTASLLQDRDNDWLETPCPVVDDDAAIAADGRKLPHNAGVLRFVTSQKQAARVLAIMMRRRRATGVARLTLAPGRFEGDWSNLSIAAGDRVNLSLNSFAMTNRPYRVLSSEISQDAQVTLELVEDPDGTWSDSVTLGPLSRRKLTPVGRTTPPSLPDAITVSATNMISDDGRAFTRVVISWDLKPWRTGVRILKDGDEVYRAEVSGDHLIWDDGLPGDYVVELRHITRQDVASRLAKATFSIDWASLRPPAVRVSAETHVGERIQFTTDAVIGQQVDTIEVRYLFSGDLETEITATITEAQWDSAPVATVRGFKPQIGSTEAGFVEVTVPATGRIKFFGRLINRAGLLGPITLLEEGVYVLPSSDLLPFFGDSVWFGLHYGAFRLGDRVDGRLPLVLTRPHLAGVSGLGANMTLNDFNGQAGWPFGANLLATSFWESEIETFDHASNAEVSFEIEFVDAFSGAPASPARSVSNYKVKLLGHSTDKTMQAAGGFTDDITALGNNTFRRLSSPAIACRMRLELLKGFVGSGVKKFNARVRKVD